MLFRSASKAPLAGASSPSYPKSQAILRLAAMSDQVREARHMDRILAIASLVLYLVLVAKRQYVDAFGCLIVGGFASFAWARARQVNITQDHLARLRLEARLARCLAKALQDGSLTGPVAPCLLDLFERCSEVALAIRADVYESFLMERRAPLQRDVLKASGTLARAGMWIVYRQFQLLTAGRDADMARLEEIHSDLQALRSTVNRFPDADQEIEVLLARAKALLEVSRDTGPNIFT